MAGFSHKSYSEFRFDVINEFDIHLANYIIILEF
jgi:hypothetical protein